MANVIIFEINSFSPIVLNCFLNIHFGNLKIPRGSSFLPIVYNVTNKTHLRVALIRRFIKFYMKSQMCSKPEIVHLFYKQKCDQRSVYGRNCIKICREFNTDNVSDILFNDVSNYFWPIPYQILTFPAFPPPTGCMSLDLSNYWASNWKKALN